YISNIDTLYDKKAVQDFRSKFMSACDGHATERIIETVFGESYKNNLRSAPLPKAPYHLEPSADDFFKNKN
ncbi:MAG: CDP-glycerol glycerophosphotransferase family protein, partial [Clostridia bacterium]|nr:CDP-glycerol glycerophosphotransferase family protein [Clostridia bacterium]